MEETFNVDSNEGSLKDFLIDNVRNEVEGLPCIITCLEEMSKWTDQSDTGIIDTIMNNNPTSLEDSVIINLWRILVQYLDIYADLYCNISEVDGEYTVTIISKWECLNNRV